MVYKNFTYDVRDSNTVWLQISEGYLEVDVEELITVRNENCCNLHSETDKYEIDLTNLLDDKEVKEFILNNISLNSSLIVNKVTELLSKLDNFNKDDLDDDYDYYSIIHSSILMLYSEVIEREIKDNINI